MNYKITLRRPWRFRDHKNNRRVLEPGTYLVPDQVAPQSAATAIAQGVALRSEVEAITAAAPEPTKKRGRPKKLAPENKKLGAAPENKSIVV